MPIDFDSRLQRPKITPSARPSIHSHNYSYSYSQQSKMVGPSKSNANNEDQDSDGHDELDNIMSKFDVNRTRSTNLRRKNSIDIEPENSLDDFTDEKHRWIHNYGIFNEPMIKEGLVDTRNVTKQGKIFSKSLPAYLPSHLNCSEVSPAKSIQSYSKYNFQQTRNVNPPQYLSESSRYSSDTSFDSSSREEKTSYFYYLIIGIAIALIACAYLQLFGKMNPSPNYVYDESTFYNDMNNIGHKYGISENSVLKIQAGISAIFENQDAGSFIFVYDSNMHNFKPVELHNFMEAVAISTARYLRNETESVEPVVDIAYKNIQSDVELISKYREEVSKSGVMLVKEVDNVPSSLAMAFHYYCDEYNPVVKKSAIFFTLDMARCPTNSAGQKPNQSHVEKCLAKKWTSVPKDNIGPLLTRVVDIVVDVTTLK